MHQGITDSSTLIDQAYLKLLTLTNVSYQLYNDENVLSTDNMPIKQIYAHCFFSQDLLRVRERMHITWFICLTERTQHDDVRGPLDWHRGKSTTIYVTISPLPNNKVWGMHVMQ